MTQCLSSIRVYNLSTSWGLGVVLQILWHVLPILWVSVSGLCCCVIRLTHYLRGRLAVCASVFAVCVCGAYTCPLIYSAMFPFMTCMNYQRKGGRGAGWRVLHGQAHLVFTSTEEEIRRGGISFEKGDKNAIYVRMLGDVRMRIKPECKRSEYRRNNTLSEMDCKLLEKLSQKDYRIRRTTRFLSPNRTGRRRRPLAKTSSQSTALLDGQYNRQAQCLLSQVGDWDFNVFSLDILTNGRPLVNVAFHLFHQYNLISIFKLDPVKLMKTFTLIEEGYHSNPYHNSSHAADVTQAMHCYITEKKVSKSITPIEIVAVLLSAMTHDLDHPGVNQAFLIATRNHLASLYENSSVLENHHWKSAAGCLQESGVFDHLDKVQQRTIVWQIKSLVLATDITRQKEFLTRFQRYLDGDFDYANNEDQRHFLLQIALKCADISNPCRTWEMSRKWSENVCEEFFRQGDYEKKLQIPVTPLCDRETTTVAKIQSGFMEYVVQPLIKEWYKFAPTKLSQKMLNNINYNLQKWKEIIDQDNAQQTIQIVDEEKENSINGNNSSDESDDNSSKGKTNDNEEESDTVEDIRLPLVYSLSEGEESPSRPASRRGSGLSLLQDIPENFINSDQRRHSMQPLQEIHENFYNSNQRRHSMPHMCLKPAEVTRVTIHRDSFPRTQYLRRRSLPTSMILRATSLEKLTGKLSALAADQVIRANRSISMEDLMMKPKISNLSPNVEASRLASGYTFTSDLETNTSASQNLKLLRLLYPQSTEPVSSSFLADPQSDSRVDSTTFQHQTTVRMPDLMSVCPHCRNCNCTEHEDNTQKSFKSANRSDESGTSAETDLKSVVDRVNLNSELGDMDELLLSSANGTSKAVTLPRPLGPTSLSQQFEVWTPIHERSTPL